MQKRTCFNMTEGNIIRLDGNAYFQIHTSVLSKGIRDFKVAS